MCIITRSLFASDETLHQRSRRHHHPANTLAYHFNYWTNSGPPWVASCQLDTSRSIGGIGFSVSALKQPVLALSIRVGRNPPQLAATTQRTYRHISSITGPILAILAPCPVNLIHLVQSVISNFLYLCRKREYLPCIFSIYEHKFFSLQTHHHYLHS